MTGFLALPLGRLSAPPLNGASPHKFSLLPQVSGFFPRFLRFFYALRLLFCGLRLIISLYEFLCVYS